MKRYILMEILKQLQKQTHHRPQLKRKLKGLAVVAGLFMVLVTGLGIWASVALFGFVADRVPTVQIDAVQLPAATASVSQMAQQGSRCWSQAQSLASVQPWLDRPLRQTLDELRVACIGQPAAGAPNELRGEQPGEYPTELEKSRPLEGHI